MLTPQNRILANGTNRASFVSRGTRPSSDAITGRSRPRMSPPSAEDRPSGRQVGPWISSAPLPTPGSGAPPLAFTYDEIHGAHGIGRAPADLEPPPPGGS